MIALAVFIGGGCGALSRYGVGLWVRRSLPEAAFPWGTFIVNLTGCFLLGFLVVWLNARCADAPAVRGAITTGFLGGLTTFSTFGVETVNLLTSGQPKLGLLYLAGNVGLGLLAAAGGLALGWRWA